MKRVALFTVCFIACEQPAPQSGPPERLAPVSGVAGPRGPTVEPSPLTTEARRVPTRGRMTPNDPRSPIFPQNRLYMLDDGLGAVSIEAGLDYLPRVLGAQTAPAPGASPRLLTRFVHLADLQLTDDESPARVARLDTTGDTNGAFRPQEGHGCRMVDAAVRTINEINDSTQLDFVLLGGDNADNAQTNEVDWVLTLLGQGGGQVDCDSGADDDLTRGPNNDVKDPFTATPLAVPYKWMTGNHDILVQGNFSIDADFKALAIGSEPKLGTRDYRLFGAPVVTSEVPADPRRSLLSRTELMEKVARDGDGHGIGPDQVETGKAYYHFDIPGTELRFVILDTSAESGGSEGILRKADITRFVKPALDQALAEKKSVVLSAHHGLHTITTNGGELGYQQPDVYSKDEWLAFLGNYPNVVYSIVGHSHQHRVRAYQASPSTAFWEVLTASLLDFPGQFRVIEIYDQDNGWLMLRATCVDFKDFGDPMLKESRELMYMDWVSGWGLDGAGERGDLNVELWVKKPTF
jgi:3',5'-cyclic AMP phosphodiesterase CpdA